MDLDTIVKLTLEVVKSLFQRIQYADFSYEVLGNVLLEKKLCISHKFAEVVIVMSFVESWRKIVRQNSYLCFVEPDFLKVSPHTVSHS